MMRNLWRMAASLMAALSLANSPATGQTTLDEGTFRLVVDGREIGSERFVIHITGSGPTAETSAIGSVVIDEANGQSLATSLKFAGAGLRPAEYRVQVGASDGDLLSGRVSGRRVSARIVSSAGENVREYLVSEGAVMIDGSVAHQHYFLARRAHAGETRIPVIVPREARQSWFTVETLPNETLNVAGTPIDCRKLLLHDEAGDTRTLWTDSEDRIIRLEIPSRKLVAERTAAPR